MAEGALRPLLPAKSPHKLKLHARLLLQVKVLVMLIEVHSLVGQGHNKNVVVQYLVAYACTVKR